MDPEAYLDVNVFVYWLGGHPTHGAKAHSWIKMVENSFGANKAFRSLPEFRRFRELCPGPTVGMLLDTGHANIHVRSDGVQGESEIGAFVRGLPLDVLEVHFSDNHGESDEHLPLGSGNLDLPALVAALKASDFAGVLTVEVCPGLVARRLDVPEEMDQIRRTADAIRAAWQSG